MSQDVKYEPPEEKKPYVAFVIRVMSNVRDFIGTYPRTEIVDIASHDRSAHQYAISLAITMDKPSGPRVYHQSPVDLTKQADLKRLRSYVRRAKVAVLEFDWSDQTYQALKSLFEETLEGARSRNEIIPGIIYIGDLNSSESKYRIFENSTSQPDVISA